MWLEWQANFGRLGTSARDSLAGNGEWIARLKGNAMNSKHLLIALSALTFSAPLFARELDCTNKDLDRAHWIPVAEMQERIAAQGHKDVVVEVVGNCYKAHYQENGRKMEGFYDPIEGHPIRRQVEKK